MQEALYTISNGLYVISVKNGDDFAGSLIDALSQVSAAPHLIMVSLSNKSHTKSILDTTGEFGVSVLPEEINPFVVANFGFQSGYKVNKWQNVASEVKDGLPYIPNALAKIRARVVDKLAYPDNTVYIAEVVAAYDVRAGEPLTYKKYRDGFKNHCLKAFAACSVSSDAAPAENKTQQESLPPDNAEKHWTCTLCGYVYEGDVPFLDLPDDWRCPLCGVGKEVFKLQ